LVPGEPGGEVSTEKFDHKKINRIYNSINFINIWASFTPKKKPPAPRGAGGFLF
jgi:hypothetical protein